jgi:hypothetical protein
VIFLQVALDNAADVAPAEDVGKIKAALAEARDIEARARQALAFIVQPSAIPPEVQLARGMAAYERGETQGLSEIVARFKAGHAAAGPSAGDRKEG